MKKVLIPITAIAFLSCAVMAIVDGVIMPGYFVKSAIKAVFFLLLPLICAIFNKDILFKELFRANKKGLKVAFLLGVSVYGLLVGGYFLFSTIFDFSNIAGKLSDNAGVDKSNFLFIALYISFANSFLEEFFFRGFIFTNLKKAAYKKYAYIFSALMFSLYHVAMMIGWFSIWLYLLIVIGLVVAGLMFNYLNEKFDTLYVSWIVHILANFAINTIGFILM